MCRLVAADIMRETYMTKLVLLNIIIHRICKEKKSGGLLLVFMFHNEAYLYGVQFKILLNPYSGKIV